MEIVKKLASNFKDQGAVLYFVGGCVRDELLGIKFDDFDLTSNLPFEKALEIFTQNNFEVFSINKKIGTCKIKTKVNQFDYATFRSEHYKLDGSHTPTKIKFIKNIRQDCKRRDFTINAIYKEVLSGKFHFFGSSKKDLKNKILKTVICPTKSFKKDALRILRLVRFAQKYDLKIEKHTLRGAVKCKDLIKNINAKTLEKEIGKMPKDIKENKLWQQLQL